MQELDSKFKGFGIDQEIPLEELMKISQGLAREDEESYSFSKNKSKGIKKVVTQTSPPIAKQQGKTQVADVGSKNPLNDKPNNPFSQDS